eukprot:scaffold251550_cov32-Tisochrysis_lutea.AAC.3
MGNIDGVLLKVGGCGTSLVSESTIFVGGEGQSAVRRAGSQIVQQRYQWDKVREIGTQHKPRERVQNRTLHVECEEGPHDCPPCTKHEDM